jgi:hypothetical protein
MIQQLYCAVTLIAFTSTSHPPFGVSWLSKLEQIRVAVVVVVVVVVWMRARLFLWVERQAPEKFSSQLCSLEESKRGYSYLGLPPSSSDQVFVEIGDKKFWEELIAYFRLIRHGQHRKRRVEQFYCCVYILCRGNVFTELLPSNNKRIHIQTQTHGRDLLSALLRWAQVPWYMYQVW